MFPYGSIVSTFIHAFFLLVLCTACAATGQAREPSGDQQGRRSGSQSFAVSLYTALMEMDGNLIFSPASVSSVLVMAYEGAKGRTRSQMSAVLDVPLDRREFHGFLSEQSKETTSPPGQPGIRLSIANALWGQTGYTFRPEFLSDLRQYHASELHLVDFSGQRETARRSINGWVEEKTGGVIRDLVKQGVVTPETRLVLTNAIHFKGLWASQFSLKDTGPGLFTTVTGESIPVEMMDQTGDFRYLETSGVKVLELPYTGGGLSMVIILPDKYRGLPEIEKSLHLQLLKTWITDLSTRYPEQVRVRLPRFTVSTEFDLSKTLARMGMPDAFEAGADFSGMTGSRELFISSVIHRAFVEVNEEGSEAAAASAAVMTKSAFMVREFQADHPFLFLIRENRNGTILFMGRVIDPKA